MKYNTNDVIKMRARDAFVYRDTIILILLGLVCMLALGVRARAEQVSIAGRGMFFPGSEAFGGAPGFTTIGPVDATGEKIAMVGRVWFSARTGSKAITRVGFRFSTVDKSGGSALTVSLQDVTLTTGPPAQPDETQDQTVAIANANASFATNTWIRTDAFSATRSVAYGERLAVVVEYDGSGRQGSDVFNLHGITNAGMALVNWGDSLVILKTASWAAAAAIPTIILEFDDGTFGTLDGAFAASDIASVTYNLDTGTTDEHALSFSVPFPCTVDGLWAWVNSLAATADFEMILYSGTTVLATTTVDGNTTSASAVRRFLVPIAPQVLAANTVYKVAIRPTVAGSGGNVMAYYFDVADANHFTVHDSGTAINYDTRLNQGAWAGVTTTRRLFAGVRISAVDDGTSGGSGASSYPIQ